MVNIFIYTVFLILLVAVFIENEKLLYRWENLKEMITSFMSVKRCRQLVEQLQSLLVSSSLKITTSKNLCSFKGYTLIVQELLELSRKYGASIQLPIRQIIDALFIEQKGLRKLIEQIKSALLQFMLVSLLAWIFKFSVEYVLQFNINQEALLIVLFLQVLGMIVFSIVFFYLHQYHFQCFEDYFLPLYLFQGLFSLGMPIQQCLLRSKVQRIKRHKKLKFINYSIDSFIQMVVKKGRCEKLFITQLISDVWSIHEQSVEVFGKHIDALKVAVLLFFYLPSYFCIIYSALSGLKLN